MKMWIARTKRKHLYLFRYKPTYNEKFDLWADSNVLDDMLQIDGFPEVTYDNSPQQVDIKLI